MLSLFLFQKIFVPRNIKHNTMYNQTFCNSPNDHNSAQIIIRVFDVQLKSSSRKQNKPYPIANLWRPSNAAETTKKDEHAQRAGVEITVSF